jgi:hypothetical protein
MFTYAMGQLTILSGGSALGRVVPNLGVNKYGMTNAIMICSMCCAILIFCVLAVKSAVGIIVFGSLYGFFTGACARNRYRSLSDFNMSSDIGLVGPMVTVLARRDSEIGERLGICFSLTGT